MEISAAEFNLIKQLLDLNDILVEAVELTRNKRVLIRVKSTQKTLLCHRCHQPTQPYGHGRTLRLRHLPILGKPTIIELTPPRGLCKHCDDKPTTTQTLSWYDRNVHYTKAYEQQILLSSIHSTKASDVSCYDGFIKTLATH